MSNGDDTFDAAKLLSEMIICEGRIARPYKDTTGHLTIGIGRNLDNGISDAEIIYLYENDVQTAIDAMDGHIPWWRRLAPNQQRAMINLCFNMGWPTFSGFVHFLADMEAYTTITDPEDRRIELASAVNELKNSRWWVEVGPRGPMVASLLSRAPENPPGT